MKSCLEFKNIFLCSKAIDLRKGIRTLSVYVQSEIKEAPFSGALFLFTGKRRTTLKALYWDKNGFALWTKSLEEEKFPWPKKNSSSKLKITSEELEWLLRGINIWKLRFHSELHYTTLI